MDAAFCKIIKTLTEVKLPTNKLTDQQINDTFQHFPYYYYQTKSILIVQFGYTWIHFLTYCTELATIKPN